MKKIYTFVYNSEFIQANSADELLEAIELKILKNPKTKFLNRKVKKYFARLVKKYGLGSEQVKLFIDNVFNLNSKIAYKEKINGRNGTD